MASSAVLHVLKMIFFCTCTCNNKLVRHQTLISGMYIKTHAGSFFTLVGKGVHHHCAILLANQCGVLPVSTGCVSCVFV